MSWKLLEQFFTRPDLELPPHETTVYAFLLHRAKDDGTAIFPSIEAISIAARKQPRQCQYILRSLEAQGYIVPVNVRGGRRRLPLWHTPLAEGPAGQPGWITPRPPAIPPNVNEQRGQKPRHVRLVPADQAEPFLDDQAPASAATGKEIEQYHQASQAAAYQAGYSGRQLRVVPQPGTVIEEIPVEAEQIQRDAFYAGLAAQIKVKRAELAEKQGRAAHYAAKLPAIRHEGSRVVMQRLAKEADLAIKQLEAELAELEELLVEQQQITGKREAL